VEGQSDNAVAIIAIITTGIVGIIAPLVSALAQRARHNAELRQVRHLDLLAAQREAIFGALQQLIRFDMTAIQGAPDDGENLVSEFMLCRLRLAAVLGADHPLVALFQHAIDTVGHNLVMKHGVDDQPKGTAEQAAAAQKAANEARDAFVHAATPYVTDTTPALANSHKT
jgi:hypothetical protein